MMAMEEHFLFPYDHQPCSSDWDPHTAFGAIADDVRHHHQLQLLPLGMESPASSSSQASTGYLQDAVAEWSGPSKRRRRLDAASPAAGDWVMTTEELQHLLQGFWDSGCNGDLLDNVKEYTNPEDDANLKVEMKEKTLLQPAAAQELSSCTSQAIKAAPACRDKKKKEEEKSVAYPFAVVKPGGVAEGEVTLDEINARILMRPRRPVRHPVGEFACGPSCVSAAGAGLSGKAVVSLTRIQTRGKGTITIIRTRG